MFKHILVPIDLSDGTARTLATALGLARQSGARVTLLHVVQRVPHIPLGELAGFYRRLEATSRRRLERAGKRVPDPGGAGPGGAQLQGRNPRPLCRAAGEVTSRRSR